MKRMTQAPDWRKDKWAPRALTETGAVAIANRWRDHRLIEQAKSSGLAVCIDRGLSKPVAIAL